MDIVREASSSSRGGSGSSIGVTLIHGERQLEMLLLVVVVMVRLLVLRQIMILLEALVLKMVGPLAFSTQPSARVPDEDAPEEMHKDDVGDGARQSDGAQQTLEARLAGQRGKALLELLNQQANFLF